jgi:hypothetical protein
MKRIKNINIYAAEIIEGLFAGSNFLQALRIVAKEN